MGGVEYADMMAKIRRRTTAAMVYLQPCSCSLTDYHYVIERSRL